MARPYSPDLRHTGTVNPKQRGGGPKIKIENNFDFLMSAENSTKTRYFTLLVMSVFKK